MASDAGLMATSQYVAAGLSFMTAAVAARLLGPTDYGIVALVIAYPTLLLSFVAPKSISVATRYVASFRASGKTDELKAICKLGYGLDLLASLLCFGLTSITGWWVARHIYNIPNLAWLMIAYASSFFFSSPIGTSRAILSSWGRFRLLAGFQILHRSFILISVVTLLLSGFGIPGMVLGMAVGHGVIGLAMASAAAHTLHRDSLGNWWRISLGSELPFIKEITAFFGWNYLTVTLAGMREQVPLMLLGHYTGAEEAGYYRLARSIMTMGSYLEASLRRVVYPALSARWGAGKRQGLEMTLRRWTMRGGLPVAILVLLTIPALPIAVPLVFGSAFRPMVLGAQLMMVGVAVSTTFFWLSASYYAIGEIGLWTKANLFYSVFVVGLAWILSQAWGFVGVASVVSSGKILFTVCLAALLISKDIH
jgi:O-antigen/teichoic acid export membrane protein